MARRAEVLLVEGAGGLLSPLGEDLDALELIRELKCEVVVAGRNRLGCVNHFFLTLLALKKAGVEKISAVLMALEQLDASGATNQGMLQKKPGFIGVYAVPWLGKRVSNGGALKNNAKIMQKTLAGILGSGKKRALLRDPQAADGKSGRKKVENTYCQPRKKPVA
jgi:dethiobiotin synthetase